MSVRRFKTVLELETAWEEYKHWCDNQQIETHDFSSKNSEFVTATLRRAITYTIEGFCVHVGLARSAFYDSYAKTKKYSDTVTRMREECEVDARRKFETGCIPTQLAGLWMSRHGYSTKAEAISPGDDRENDNLYDAISQAVKQIAEEKGGRSR